MCNEATTRGRAFGNVVTIPLRDWYAWCPHGPAEGMRDLVGSLRLSGDAVKDGPTTWDPPKEGAAIHLH
jgi:hypothetical protein